MNATMLYGTRDIRFEARPDPTILRPTDAIVRIAATCVCGSDLWPYRGIQAIAAPTRWAMNIVASSKRSAIA
jgi:threonine dehydrogenase-like Zn-dependent dehydrogenase